jgi:hypothetical protein
LEPGGDGFSKDWKRSGDIFQALEKAGGVFPSLERGLVAGLGFETRLGCFSIHEKRLGKIDFWPWYQGDDKFCRASVGGS